jgi:N-dimethylarginine dimethylaminohydrolase
MVAGHDFISSGALQSCTECSYQVKWQINAHMKPGRVNPAMALTEHAEFCRMILDEGGALLQVPFVHGAYDSVFVKDNALLRRVRGRIEAYLTNPACAERRQEQMARKTNFNAAGIRVVGSAARRLEGGDVVNGLGASQAFLGFGFRSERASAVDVSRFLGKPVISLELKDPYFYHLDTALAVLNDGTVLACKEAFTSEAWAELTASVPSQKLIEIPRSEAMNFGLNLIEVGDTVILGGAVTSTLSEALHALGRKVRTAPLSQFQLAGGSAACLTAPIHRIN